MLTVVLVAGLVSMALHRSDCPLCVRRTTAELRKIRYRIPLLCVNLVGPVLIAALAFLFLAPTPPIRQHTDLDALRTMRISAVLIAPVLLLAAVQFRRRNEQALAPPWWGGMLSALGRASKRVGHYTHWLSIGTCTALVPCLLLLPRSGPWEAGLRLLMLIAAGATCASLAHSLDLCARCTIDYDLNQEFAKAASGRRYLLLDHRLTMPAFAWLCIAGTAGASQMLFKENTPYVMAFLFLLAIPKTILSRFHNRLVLWCPICSRGDGGNDDDEKTPAPDSPGGRRLPLPSV
ncbi:hypothetical protein ACFXKW_21105 [Streptomyces sp. NPDC059193]|uniref:hypothetical protein n=1 Tax=Streptomyces sp. NPDC059193 TaxID=3346763 RepID=UPI0036C83378